MWEDFSHTLLGMLACYLAYRAMAGRIYKRFAERRTYKPLELHEAAHREAYKSPEVVTDARLGRLGGELRPLGTCCFTCTCGHGKRDHGHA